MKMFFSFLPAAVLAIVLLPCEGRVRRQIWPAPADPNFYWDDRGDDRDFFENGDFWLRPQRFDQPFRFDEPMRFDESSRNENTFRDDFNSGRNQNDRNQNDWNQNDWNQNDRNQNDRNQNAWNQNDWNQNDRNQNERNQNNRRTTTESLGPITSPPKTVHIAPQGCECPMTQQFNPVCGTDGQTYRNKGLLDCYARCGTNVSQKRLGTC